MLAVSLFVFTSATENGIIITNDLIRARHAHSHIENNKITVFAVIAI